MDTIGPPRKREELLDWLQLIRTDSVGPITFFGLLRRYGNARAALAALPALAARGRTQVTIAPRPAIEAEDAQLRSFGGRWLAVGDPAYPAPLAAIVDPPPVLAVKGEGALFARPMLAIVGARNASAAGRRFAETLARDLGNAGFAVVSGLARGIDTAAHHGALATGTVAALAGGIDIPYPAANAELQAEIARRGTLVAEMPFGLEPRALNFPRRNRLIAGLAKGVIVVEAALKSGSLITARQALDQGREVFAVPGAPADPRARGTNDLIRQGAWLVESADDVIAALGRPAPTPPPVRPATPAPPVDTAPPAEPRSGSESNAQASEIYSLLSQTPTDIDELVRHAHLTPATVLTILLGLELAGRIVRHPGGRVSLTDVPA
ncbi:MAG: DNA-protecting protein DprA [Alphaproteobacteria bacterium]|nr:DNA-protecting protein DprA [Alphaproteobacteria bacterium]